MEIVKKKHFFLRICQCFVLIGDAVVPRRGKMPGLKIFHRFHFSSALKRMSVIAGFNPPGSSDTSYIATVKGAPEILKTMVRCFFNLNGFLIERLIFKVERFQLWSLFLSTRTLIKNNTTSNIFLFVLKC